MGLHPSIQNWNWRLHPHASPVHDIFMGPIGGSGLSSFFARRREPSAGSVLTGVATAGHSFESASTGRETVVTGEGNTRKNVNDIASKVFTETSLDFWLDVMPPNCAGLT